MMGRMGRWAEVVTPRSRRDYGRIAVAVALLVGVLLATTATAYQSTRLLSGDQSAWLQKGRTIAQINGPSARYEATAADQPMSVAGDASDFLQIVQEANGQVYTVDPRTHRVFRLDLSTMTPTPGPPGTSIIAAGAHVFILDNPRHTLTPANARTLAPGKAIRVPGPVASSAITSNGTVYLGGTNGKVYVVKRGKLTTTTLTSHQGPVDVSVLGGEPVAVMPSTGGLYNLGSSHPAPVPLPGNPGAPVALSGSQPTGPLWLVRGNLLLGADVGTGQVQQVPLPAGDTYGDPVTNAGKVYVPDTTAGKVYVFDASTLAPQAAVPVPAGTPGDHDIETVVRDGDLWVDNPTSERGKLVAPDGRVTTIDKGTGDGVVDPQAPPTTTAPAPAPTPVPSPAPSPAPFPVPAPTGPAAPVPTPTGTGPVSLPALPGNLSPGSPPGITGPLPSPPTPSPTSPPSTPTPPPNPSAGTAAVPDTNGDTTTAACAALTSAGLQCNPSVNYVATPAPSGKPSIVVGSTPAPGAKVAKNTAVQLTEDEVAVPAPSSGEGYTTYCPTVDNDQFTCQPVAGGQGPVGSSPGQVASVSPSPGTLAPPGTPIKVTYYQSAAVPTVAVPNCQGLSPAACQSRAPAGLTVVPQSQSVAEAIACNTVYAQSQTAGTQVQAGTTMAVQYDPVCSQTLYEYQYTGAVSGNTTHPYVHDLTFSATPPGTAGNWSQSAGARAYQPVNGACSGAGAKAGTQPLWEWTYKDSTGFDHYYFNDITPGPPGWTQGPVIACIFPRLGGQPPGSATPVYANYLGNPQNVPTTSYYNVPTADDSWTAGGSGSGTSYMAWYQPQV